GGFLIGAVVQFVAGHADDLVPVILAILPDLFAQGGGWIAPILAGEIFRNQHHRREVVDVRPREVAAGDQRVAYRFEEPGRNELEAAYGRKAGFLIGSVLGKDKVVAGPS